MTGLKGGAAGGAVAVTTLLIIWWASSCQGDGWECLEQAAMALFGALLLAPVLSWIVLRLLHVKWAFAVAVSGTLTTLLLVTAVPAPSTFAAIPLMVLVVTAAGYAASAVALSRATSPWVKWMYVAGLLLFVIIVLQLL
jgi:hypothetical protein